MSNVGLRTMLPAVPGLSGLSGLSTSAPVVAALPAELGDGLLINGGLEIWQRGAGPFTTAGGFTADRWMITTNGGSTLSVTRDSANADAGSQYALAVAATIILGCSIQQPLENYLELRGRTVTFVGRVKTSTVNAVRLRIFDGVAGLISAFHPGDGTYQTLVLTATIGAAATMVRPSLEIAASCTAYLDSATMVQGAQPLPYTPVPTARELERCQRYYQEYGGLDSSEVLAFGQNFSPTVGHVILVFPVEMAIPPTVTVSAPADWRAVDAGGGSVPLTVMTPGLITRRSCRLLYNVAAGLVAGQAVHLLGNATAAARVRLESNP